ncbi:DUF2892 domain-containing protein [Candidatus Woesearchaeota archaeon]|nr:DUF2892 domain-containing protein [Candidatus Woesearchaeota archaeon]
MKQNLGITDRVLRFTLAFWLLGPWQPQFNIRWLNWIVLIIGVIALIESFIATCWLHTIFKINNKNQ